MSLNKMSCVKVYLIYFLLRSCKISEKNTEKSFQYFGRNENPSENLVGNENPCRNLVGNENPCQNFDGKENLCQNIGQN